MVSFWVCISFSKYIKELGAFTSVNIWTHIPTAFRQLTPYWFVKVSKAVHCFKSSALSQYKSPWFMIFHISADYFRCCPTWTIVTSPMQAPSLPCEEGSVLKRNMLNSTFSASLHEVKECWHNIPEVLWEIKMVMTREWKQLVRKKDKRMRGCFVEVASKSWTSN